MKTSLLVLVSIALVASGGQTQRVPYKDTQLGMNEAADKELRAAEREMSTLVENLVSKPGASPAAVAKLKEAQASWEAYRDAQLHAMWPFPERDSYGSVYPMCVAISRTALTKLRVAELQAMLNPLEYDACSSQWPGQ
jgi:uncharacterized protein YecT (DUF1311 family)